MTLFDISPRLSSKTAVWPGDVRLEREVTMDVAKGDEFTLSSLKMTTHVGAHVDAPRHFFPDKPGIGEQNLNHYIGPCQVIRVDVKSGQAMGAEVVSNGISAERVLFATGTYPNTEEFNQDYAALSVELVVSLQEADVKLIGIDTPSVDLFSREDCPVHKACFENDIAILEGIVLGHVPEGVYELIALPLKLVECDASPVRAVLRSLDFSRSNRSYVGKKI